MKCDFQDKLSFYLGNRDKTLGRKIVQEDDIQPSRFGYEIHHSKCFGCGKDNPIGLKANFTYDTERNQVYFVYNFQEDYNGAPSFVHGGIISTLLDETMGSLCFHLGFLVMTDEMCYKYHKPTPVKTDLLANSWVIKKEKRKIHLECKLCSLDDSIIYVTGRGIFHILPDKYFTMKLNVKNKHDRISSTMLKNRETRSHLLLEKEELLNN